MPAHFCPRRQKQLGVVSWVIRRVCTSNSRESPKTRMGFPAVPRTRKPPPNQRRRSARLGETRPRRPSTVGDFARRDRVGRGGTRRAMGGDSPKEHRSPLKPGKGRRGKVESRLFQRMPQRTRQKHQRRLLRAVRAVPRTLALVVVLYAVSLVIYFGKYRVRPRHHHAPELPAVLREGEVETSSARRLLCSAAPLRDRSPLFGDDDGFGFGFGADGGAGGGRGGARERDDGAPGGVPSRIDGVSTLGAGHSADASASGGDGATTDASSSRRSGKKTTRDDAGSSAGSAFASTRGAPLSIKRGRFRGHPKTFRPPDRELSGLNATDARVFVLAGAAASDPAAPALLEQFAFAHHVDVAKVPASHVMVVARQGRRRRRRRRRHGIEPARTAGLPRGVGGRGALVQRRRAPLGESPRQRGG